MVKNHLKRLNAPKSWKIERKGITFVTKANPGPHKKGLYIPLNIIIRDMLGYAKNARETRAVLKNEVLVDGIVRKESRFPIGLMDVIEFKDIKKYFRVILNKKGKLTVVPIKGDEGDKKLCKITGKTKVKRKIQLNLHDGKCILVDGKEEYKVGDSLLIKIPKSEITSRLKLEKGNNVYLMGGKHIGDDGKILDIIDKKIKYKSVSGEIFETLKEYAFVIGKDKPMINLK